MNQINAVIEKVLKKREFNSTIEWDLDSDDKLHNTDYIEFECITKDMGGCQKELLICKKSECQEIKEGYIFKH